MSSLVTSAEEGNTTAPPVPSLFTIQEFQEFQVKFNKLDPRTLLEAWIGEKVRFAIVALVPEKRLPFTGSTSGTVTLVGLFGHSSPQEVEKILARVWEKAVEEAQAQIKNAGRIV